MMGSQADECVQADLPEPDHEDETVKIRALERITRQTIEDPPEPSSYGKGKLYSRPWILTDGHGAPGVGSETRETFTAPVKAKSQGEGIRKRMLTDFFWRQMMTEVLEELSQKEPVDEYCTEYDANFVKDNFEPRNFEVTTDKELHLKYPLYGAGSSPITLYSETIKKTGAGDILEPFRRTQDFTKPMSERLDNGWVL